MNIKITVSESAEENGRRAAKKIAELIRAAIESKGRARIVVSTGSSQFEMFSALIKEEIEE